MISEQFNKSYVLTNQKCCYICLPLMHLTNFLFQSCVAQQKYLKINYLLLLYLIETTKSVLLLCKIKNLNLIMKKKLLVMC